MGSSDKCGKGHANDVPWLAEETKSSLWLVNELTSIMLFPSPRSIKVMTSIAAPLTSADLSVFSTADTQLKIWLTQKRSCFWYIDLCMLINSELRRMGPLPNEWSKKKKTGSFGLFCPNVPIFSLQENTSKFETSQPSWAGPVWTPRTVHFGTAILAMFPWKWPQMGQVSTQTEYCVYLVFNLLVKL